MKALRQTIAKHQLDSWAADQKGSNSLKGLKLKAGPSKYLLTDPRHISPLRARLRLDRSSLNASLALRRVVASPLCQTCNVPETTEHCLLHCPTFAAARQACKDRLANLYANFDMPTLLGCILGSPGNVPFFESSVLQVTGDYLVAIHLLRKL